MRCTTFALRIALIAGLSVMAQSSYGQGNYAPPPNNNVNGGPQKFGSATCRDSIPCASGSTYFSASDLAAAANMCVSSSLGLTLPDGFFDQSAGLDGSGCLSIRTELLSKKDAKTILPKCCEVSLPDGACSFHCDLVNGW